MPATTYLKQKLMDHLCAGIPYTMPSTLYVALHSANPGVDGTYGEVTGNGIARVAVVLTGTGGTRTNAADVVFPKSTPSGHGSVPHFSIRDALTGGNSLFYNFLTGSPVVSADEVPRIPAGTLVVTCT